MSFGVVPASLIFLVCELFNTQVALQVFLGYVIKFFNLRKVIIFLSRPILFKKQTAKPLAKKVFCFPIITCIVGSGALALHSWGVVDGWAFGPWLGAHGWAFVWRVLFYCFLEITFCFYWTLFDIPWVVPLNILKRNLSRIINLNSLIQISWPRAVYNLIL